MKDMRVFSWVFGTLVAGTAAFAQTTPARPEFEVASIRPSGAQPPNSATIGLHIDGAQVSFNYLSLKDYLTIAYQLKLYQISGPEWVGSTRFDITAKLPAGAKREDVPPMLQALFEDRFQMKTHRESKEFPVYALVVVKGGPKLKESPLDPEVGESGPGDPGAPKPGGLNVSASGGRGGMNISYGRGSGFTFGNGKFEGKKLPMATFVEALARFMDRPVIDMTDLKSTYDFTLEVTPEDMMAMQVRAAIAAGVTLPPEAMRLLQSPGDSLFAAVQALGLKLESRKAPLDVLVIDQIQKAPTEN